LLNIISIVAFDILAVVGGIALATLAIALWMCSQYDIKINIHGKNKDAPESGKDK
jgi:hypothetical protein